MHHKLIIHHYILLNQEIKEIMIWMQRNLISDQQVRISVWMYQDTDNKMLQKWYLKNLKYGIFHHNFKERKAFQRT